MPWNYLSETENHNDNVVKVFKAVLFDSAISLYTYLSISIKRVDTQ